MNNSLPTGTDTRTASQRIRVFLRWVERRPDIEYSLSVYGREPSLSFVYDTPGADHLVDVIPFTTKGEWARNGGEDEPLGVLYGRAWGCRVSVLATDRYPAASTRVGAVA